MEKEIFLVTASSSTNGIESAPIYHPCSTESEAKERIEKMVKSMLDVYGDCATKLVSEETNKTFVVINNKVCRQIQMYSYEKIKKIHG